MATATVSNRAAVNEPHLRIARLNSPLQTHLGVKGPLPLRSSGPSTPTIPLHPNSPPLAYFYSAIVVWFCSALDTTVTPAVRANDTTDIHVIRGSVYPEAPSRPFSSTTIDHIQAGRSLRPGEPRKAHVNLGLYSLTFNNHSDRDLESLTAYKAFRQEAEEKGFNHFLEVFGPNVPADVHRIQEQAIPSFLNDHIVRLLAGIPSVARPQFLKIPYYGPAAMEEICTYDPSLVVGVLGGSAGTTHDAFELLHSAKKYGARVALFGRKINAAEHQLSFVEHLRRVAEDEILPAEAVKSYHSTLARLRIPPHRSVKQDLELTSSYLNYGTSKS
jgi:hypothetical protein